jgi:hypothetical protein
MVKTGNVRNLLMLLALMPLSGYSGCGNYWETPMHAWQNSTAPSHLRFMVHDGEPTYTRIANAQVTILAGAGSGRSCTTNTNGECSIRDITVASGDARLRIQAEHPSYQPALKEMGALAAGGTNPLIYFELEPR